MNPWSELGLRATRRTVTWGAAELVSSCAPTGEGKRRRGLLEERNRDSGLQV